MKDLEEVRALGLPELTRSPLERVICDRMWPMGLMFRLVEQLVAVSARKDRSKSTSAEESSSSEDSSCSSIRFSRGSSF